MLACIPSQLLVKRLTVQLCVFLNVPHMWQVQCKYNNLPPNIILTLATCLHAYLYLQHIALISTLIVLYTYVAATPHTGTHTHTHAQACVASQASSIYCTFVRPCCRLLDTQLLPAHSAVLCCCWHCCLVRLLAQNVIIIIISSAKAVFLFISHFTFFFAFAVRLTVMRLFYVGHLHLNWIAVISWNECWKVYKLRCRIVQAQLSLSQNCGVKSKILRVFFEKHFSSLFITYKNLAPKRSKIQTAKT